MAAANVKDTQTDELSVPVCIVGCGPIGLTGALLLSRFGIKSLLIDKRTALNTHPRSRFVDTNTMELMRELGLEKTVEDTGLGPDWTEYNRWFDALTRNEFARIPSPTFHTVPRTTSPTLPVMTCQDYVEEVLLAEVRKDANIDLRFSTEARTLSQDDSQVALQIVDLGSNAVTDVRSEYLIGADGPNSFAREAIGAELETDPFTNYSQDVIFEADLSRQVEGRKAGLLYNCTPEGVLVFQPLNGVTRWRCQIFGPEPVLAPDEELIRRIRQAIGAEEEIPIEIVSTGVWQPTPGCVTSFRDRRIFLAGDAAHVAVPTGGMGNNTGFAGIRNLAWKLAFVLKGQAPESILSTYETEHKPHALMRIDAGVATSRAMGTMLAAFYKGEDVAPGRQATQQYADHDGVLMGFELCSELIHTDSEPPPAVNDPTIDFIPCVRGGRRAPHVWVDEAAGRSVLDWFGSEYVLVMGSAVDAGRWQDAVAQLVAETDFPLRAECLPTQAGDSPYRDDEVVLIRPDGIIADHWAAREEVSSERLHTGLPIRN